MQSQNNSNNSSAKLSPSPPPPLLSSIDKPRQSIKASDIGYFDSEAKDIEGTKIILYIDIFSFTNRLVYLVEVYNNDIKLREN
jgi:hypothetical protein